MPRRKLPRDDEDEQITLSGDPPTEGISDFVSFAPTKPRRRSRPRADRSAQSSTASQPVAHAAIGDAAIIEGLTGLYAITGAVAAQVNQYDGMVILDRASAMAVTVVNVAHHHPSMYRALQLLTSNSDYVTIVTVHAGVLCAVAANHGFLPGGRWLTAFGIDMMPPPGGATGQAPQPSTNYAPSPLGMGPSAPPPQDGHTPTATDAARVQFPPDLQAELEQQAMAYMMSQLGYTAPTPGYSPDDTEPRPEQNPAILQNLVDRR